MLTAGDQQSFLYLQPPQPCVSGADLKAQRLHERITQDEPGSQQTHVYREFEAHMRSELVYSAGLKIENRFLLSATVIRAVRKLHVSSSRTEDTLNRVFADVAEGRYAHGALPEIEPPPPIDVLVVTPSL